ncbi:hemerythrin domain-containing protein [Acidovorax sp. Root219]|uniref:hemerythrin domain-containing protein n=1 Tax=Acidovorax sp. Root219 TaxID=1736493 RepID=UPI000710578E|nr:hemerythrin domain-containing protein [Acidovorax sp. Root219]KRC32611.1 hemerythrin [Acidovorax sp. Root219]
MSQQNIFEALRESHELQRDLYRRLTETSGDTPERQELFLQLKTELAAHELAEDRNFYAPLMQLDAGMDLSRHAISEHHQIDELVESLEEADPATPAWLPLAKKLAEKVEHHLKEEEHRFFQMAGKLLTEKQKISLAGDYLTDYDEAKAATA